MPKGRGSNKRKKGRKAERARSQPSRRPNVSNANDLLEVLETISSANEFATLVERRPELIGAKVLAEFERMNSHPGLEGSGLLFIELVRAARDDPSAAWDAHQARIAEAEAGRAKVEGAEGRIRAAILQGEFSKVEELAGEAFAHAERFGLALFRAMLHEAMATAFMETAHGDRADNVDRSIEHGAEALKLAVDDEHFATLAANQGVRLADRKYGDPAVNREQADELLREAISRLEPNGPSEMLARCQTNLAFNLQQRERGDRLQNLREAEELCYAALTFRSTDVDPSNWVYTKLNLGSVLDDLAFAGEADVGEAIGHLEDVIAARDRIPEPWLVGHAQSSLAAVHRRLADGIAADERSFIGPGPPPPPGEEEMRHLTRARGLLEASFELLDPTRNREVFGRSLGDYGQVLAASGDEDSASEPLREAIKILRPNLRHKSVQLAGGKLGDMLARRGDWTGAAEAFEAAFEAHETAVMARTASVDRAAEIEAVGNKARWAAYAIAAAGDPARSVLILETSRARELRRRLGLELPDERAGDLPDDARLEYLDALQGVLDAQGDQQTADAEFRLQYVLAQIRSLDGYGDFGSGARWSEVASAVEPGWPLVYVNPTPYGTVLLTVDRADRSSAVNATFLDISSHEVFMALMFGEFDLDNPVSYLAGVDEFDERVFPRALEEALEPLGRRIAEPLRDQLVGMGALGVTLVLCGPIGLAPLHAAPWITGAERECLLDHLSVRTTPSALLLGTCRRRREARLEQEAAFVALANPDTGDPRDDLPGTDAEVEHLTSLFDPSEARVARRADATSEFLKKNAGTAAYLHLACHGKGGLIDPTNIAIWLSDRRVSGSELVAAEFPTRLTVLSACQTAVAAITQAPDEVTALSTIFLGTGSSAVVAAQWSVDDAATALLITNFYERMLGDDEAPAVALRHAQLWLRDLSDAQEAKYLKDRPALAAEFRRRGEEGQRPGFRGVAPSSSRARPTQGRYSHPQYWAPFVASGAA